MPHSDSAEATGAIWWISGYGAGLKRGGSRFVPPSVASPFGHGVAVLKARSMGRGIGGSAAMSGPLALFQSTSHRDVTRNALCGWAGRAGEPLLGG